MNHLNIFISSTCYDLGQVRTDLSDFIKNSGNNPILSEEENFPISPQLSTLENCIRNVKEYADILILIIGNRYGYITNNGKSITNNEYIVAKQKGIPVFCFIDKKIINVLPFWKQNPQADFSKTVEDVRVFEFVDEIRNDSKIWTFDFEKAQDIINIFKIQSSYLFKESLKSWLVLNRDVPELFKINISEKAMKIFLEKKELYEFDFFAQTLIDEIEKKEFQYNDIKYSIFTTPQHFLNDLNEIPEWSTKHLSSVLSITNSFVKLINDALPSYLGNMEKASDFKGLYYVSVKYAELFEHLIKWVIAVQSTYAEDALNLDRLKFAVGNLIKKPIEIIKEFPYKFRSDLEEKKIAILAGEDVGNLVIPFNIAIDPKDQIEFSNALLELTKSVQK